MVTRTTGNDRVKEYPMQSYCLSKIDGERSVTDSAF